MQIPCLKSGFCFISVNMAKKSFSLSDLGREFGVQGAVSLERDREIYELLHCEEDAFSDYEDVVEEDVEIFDAIDADNDL